MLSSGRAVNLPEPLARPDTSTRRQWACRRASAKLGAMPDLDLLHISIADQMLYAFREGRLLLRLPVSTALSGVGELNGSGCTPRGLHQVRARIGAGLPLGAVLRGRRWTGEVWSPD